MINITKKLKNDKGNAVIVLGIMLIVVVLTIGAMLLDITKAFQMKAAYNDAAQKAAQAAIMHTNQQGYLTANSIGEAVRVYENVARPATIKDGFMSSCDRPRSIDIKIYAMKDDFKRGQLYSIDDSSRVRISDTAEDITNRFLSHIEINEFEGKKYTGIEIELQESTPNIILPNTSVIAGINDGKAYKCQELGIRAGASKYIGKEGIHD